MNPLRHIVVLLRAVALATIVARAPAAEPRVLNVCVVDAARNSAVDAAFQQSFATRIGELACAAVREELRTQAEQVSSREAANRLTHDACDAVLVIGSDRPRALQRIDAVAFAGTLGWERNGAHVYLIVGNRAARLQRELAEAFRTAISADARRERRVAAR